MEIGAKIEEIKEIGRESGKKRGMAEVRMEDRKQKMKVMKKKVTLRNEMVRTRDDWTTKERAMQ